MGRSVDVDDLVSAGGIAERMGLAHYQTVHLWRKRHEDFPAPVLEQGHIVLWLWTEIEEWARSTGRL